MTNDPPAERTADETDTVPPDNTVGRALIRVGWAVRNVSLPPDLMGMYFLG
jgi:hypothetical protein